MKKSLVVYLTAGYPDRRTFLKACEIASDEGSDLLEIGLPFSDPVADGPVIQKTSQAAIRSGMNFDRTLDLAVKIPRSIPRVMMTYANPLYVRGWARAFSEIQRAGFEGCILPDVPAEELSTCLPFRPSGFYLVPFVAPTTSRERLKTVSDLARDGAFIYVVSLRGITGVRAASAAVREISNQTRLLRRLTHAPIFIGFGIQTGADAARFGRICDGVIVGSAALQALDRGLSAYARLLRELRSSLDRL